MIQQRRVAAQAGKLGLEPTRVVGIGEAGDPFGGGGEQDPVPGPAGADRQLSGRVGLAKYRPLSTRPDPPSSMSTTIEEITSALSEARPG